MTPQEFAALAAQEYNRIPVSREVLADADTPVSAYKKLAASSGEAMGTLGGLLGSTKDALDLDKYATDKALDGLFELLAREEKSIRENPVARSTDLLKKVFQ